MNITTEFEQITEREEAASGTPEAAFFLKLYRAGRPGPSFSAGRNFKILLGNVIEVPGGTEFDYPTTNETEFLIIPTTTRVVIHEWEWDDYNGDDRRVETIHTFNVSRGWHSFTI